MNIAQSILYLYPNAVPGVDFVVQDNSDGKGQYIAYWNVKDSTGAVVAKPTDTQLTSAQLPASQKAKMTELNNACNNAILGNFTSTVGGVSYQFSYDTEAQANFSKAGRAFDKGFITSTSWTAYDANGNVVRVTLNATDFDTVFKDSLTHVNSNVSRFRDTLQPQVTAATTVAAVNAIVW